MTLRIHLIDLAEADAALLRRILDFANRQGRGYHIVERAPEANLLIAADPALLDGVEGHDAQRLLLGAGQPRLPGVHHLDRPLLVTRVLRELDRIAESIPETATAEEPAAREPPARDRMRSRSTALVARRETPLAVIRVYAWQQRLHAARAATTEPTVKTTTTSRYRALVVDDSLAIRKQLELELRDAGFNADFAEDGERALEKTAHNHYDLIFLDIMMPGIDGYEVCRALRKQPRWKKTPITMLSGKTSPLDEVEGVLAGCSTYLTKPIRHDDFQKMLERVRRWIDAVKEKRAAD